MTGRCPACLPLVALLVSLCASARADNWPQWRGPLGNGICDEKNLPTKWSSVDEKSEGIAWEFRLPGPGGASPIVWDDKVFVTSVDEDDKGLLLFCVGTDGKQRWKHSAGTGNLYAMRNESNSASPSPSTDGKHVWAFFGTGLLLCCDLDGHEVWRTNIQERYGKFTIQFGMTSTPVLDGDRLYLQLIHGDGDPETREALVVCLDKETGNEVWKQPRPSPASAENEHSYASPVLYRDDKQAFLLTHGADYIVAHSLDDGHELWRSSGMQPANYDYTLRLVASPVAVPGLIVAPSAKRGNVVALKPGGAGDISKSELRLWTFPTTPDVPSPLIHDGLVYLYRESGVLIVLDAATGEQKYEQRIKGDTVNRASPVWADGNIYVIDRKGTTTVVKAGPKFELVSANPLPDGVVASPAFSNGRIYIRSYESLWAIGR